MSVSLLNSFHRTGLQNQQQTQQTQQPTESTKTRLLLPRPHPRATGKEKKEKKGQLLPLPPIMNDESKSLRSTSADTALNSPALTPDAASMDADREVNGNGNGHGIVLRRKKPIAAWRLGVMFAW